VLSRSDKTLAGRKLLLGMLGVLVVVVSAIAIPSFSCRPADPKLDDLGVIPSFHLFDERGQPFTEQAFAHHVTIVSFLFTRCDTICPVTTMKMQRIQEKTFDIGDRIELLSFSVDPGYDTSARLAEYAQRYRADPARWRFVTGPVADVHALIEGPLMTSMAVEEVRPNGVPNIAHGGYFLLVGPDRVIRGTYDSNDLNRLDELIHDARYLARVSL
jgi:protein SCO1/2